MQFLRRISKLTPILRPTLQQISKENPIETLTRRTFCLLNPGRTPLAPGANLLDVQPVQLQAAAGFKVRVNLKKRCKDCYFVRRSDRLFVICPTHRRHKQMQMVKDERNTWILSHATQSKVRHW